MEEARQRHWLPSLLARIARHRGGVAAVEFAVIAPVLVLLYVLASEAGQAIDTNRKLAGVASTAGDLAAQQYSLTAAEIDAILKIGTAILQPYNRSVPTISLTGIEIRATSDGGPTKQEGRVLWSRRLADGVGLAAVPAGTAVTVPDSLLVPGTFILQAEAQLEYQPVLAAVTGRFGGTLNLFHGLGMRKVYYMRPRQTTSIPCPDC